MTRDPADFAAFAAAFPPRVQALAVIDDGLASAYWRARHAGHHHDVLVQAARSASTATNPIGAAIARIRPLADTSPPAVVRRPEGPSHIGTHRPCPDAHPDCELCLCDPDTGAVHHVATPMPDWFRQAWNELRVARTGLMP